MCLRLELCSLKIQPKAVTMLLHKRHLVYLLIIFFQVIHLKAQEELVELEFFDYDDLHQAFYHALLKDMLESPADYPCDRSGCVSGEEFKNWYDGFLIGNDSRFNLERFYQAGNLTEEEFVRIISDSPLSPEESTSIKKRIIEEMPFIDNNRVATYRLTDGQLIFQALKVYFYLPAFEYKRHFLIPRDKILEFKALLPKEIHYDNEAFEYTFDQALIENFIDPEEISLSGVEYTFSSESGKDVLYLDSYSQNVLGSDFDKLSGFFKKASDTSIYVPSQLKALSIDEYRKSQKLLIKISLNQNPILREPFGSFLKIYEEGVLDEEIEPFELLYNGVADLTLEEFIEKNKELTYVDDEENLGTPKETWVYESLHRSNLDAFNAVFNCQLGEDFTCDFEGFAFEEPAEYSISEPYFIFIRAADFKDLAQKIKDVPEPFAFDHTHSFSKIIENRFYIPTEFQIREGEVLRYFISDPKSPNSLWYDYEGYGYNENITDLIDAGIVYSKNMEVIDVQEFNDELSPEYPQLIDDWFPTWLESPTKYYTSVNKGDRVYRVYYDLPAEEADIANYDQIGLDYMERWKAGDVEALGRSELSEEFDQAFPADSLLKRPILDFSNKAWYMGQEEAEKFKELYKDVSVSDYYQKEDIQMNFDSPFSLLGIFENIEISKRGKMKAGGGALVFGYRMDDIISTHYIIEVSKKELKEIKGVMGDNKELNSLDFQIDQAYDLNGYSSKYSFESNADWVNELESSQNIYLNDMGAILRAIQEGSFN